MFDPSPNNKSTMGNKLDLVVDDQNEMLNLENHKVKNSK
jgi:hypothetical protein